MIKSRYWGAPLAAVLGVGMLAGCGAAAATPAHASARASGAKAGSATTLKPFAIGYPAVDADFLVEWVGIDQGIFKKNGLNATMDVLSGSGSETGALLSGSLQMVLSDSTAGLTAIAQGAPAVFVGSEENVFPTEIVGKPSIHSLTGLEGQTLGLEHVNSLMWSAAVQTLQDHHIPVSSVHLDYLGAPTTNLAGLLSGKVDAMVNNSPFVNEAEAKGFKLIYSMRKTPYVSAGFLVTKSFLAQNPSEITDFLKGYVQASVYAHNPANAKVVKQDIGTAMHITSPTLLNDIYQYYLPMLQINPTIPQKTMTQDINNVNQSTGKSLTFQQTVNLSLLNQLNQSGFIKKAQAGTT